MTLLNILPGQKSGGENSHRRKINKKKKRLIMIIIIILTAALIVCAFWYGFALRSYTVYSEKVSTQIRAVLITDLHSCLWGDDQSPLLNPIIAAAPDVILLAGDIVDDRANKRAGAELFFEGITAIAPVYYVSGNHEMAAKNHKEIYEFIAGYGITVLSDEFDLLEINGNKLIIAGVDDPVRGIAQVTQEATMQRVFAGLEDMDGCKILLAHRPERIEIYKNFGFDIVLSGHAHGGQVRLPLIINGLYAPHQGLFPKYAGGVYTHQTKTGILTHIVSRGTSVFFFPPRIFNPPEIVVIDIMPGN